MSCSERPIMSCAGEILQMLQDWGCCAVAVWHSGSGLELGCLVMVIIKRCFVVLNFYLCSAIQLEESGQRIHGSKRPRWRIKASVQLAVNSGPPSLRCSSTKRWRRRK